MKKIQLSILIFLFYLSALSQNTFPAVGNVGVGTTTPLVKFQVESTTAGSSIAASYGTNGANGFVQLWDDNAILWKYGNANGGLRFLSATDLNAANFSEKMKINDNGYIGIGIGDPRSKLDIWSGSLSVTGVDLNGTAHISSQAGIAYYGNNSFTNGIAIDPLGNIGIGTSDAKGYKLAVNGNSIFTGVKVKTFGTWPDYVFSKNYKLLSLKSVEEYILKYQHLPGVPSASEVLVEGLDIGKNQSLLLEKIEELTLYILELQKELLLQKEKLSLIEENHQCTGCR